MSTAFELSCADLKVLDDPGREVIATRIVDIARGGEFDAESLHQRGRGVEAYRLAGDLRRRSYSKANTTVPAAISTMAGDVPRGAAT